MRMYTCLRMCWCAHCEGMFTSDHTTCGVNVRQRQVSSSPKQCCCVNAARYGQPEEVAGLVRFLASDPAAAYITGQVSAASTTGADPERQISEEKPTIFAVHPAPGGKLTCCALVGAGAPGQRRHEHVNNQLPAACSAPLQHCSDRLSYELRCLSQHSHAIDPSST